MEITLGQVLTVIVGLSINAILLVVYTIRQEGKLMLVSAECESLKAEVKELWAEVDKHKTNAEIHFSLAVSNQVQKRTDEKFTEVEKQLTKMESSFDAKFRELKVIIEGIKR